MSNDSSGGNAASNDQQETSSGKSHPLASAVGQGGSAKMGGFLVLLGLLAFGTISALLSGSESSSPTQERASPTAAPPRLKITDLQHGEINGERVEVVTVSAMGLFREYERNEVATDIRLKGKIVEIHGTVTGINKDFWDSVYVTLRTPNEFMSATVRPIESEIDKIARLQKRQSVAFRCEKMQRFAGSPSGSNCVLM